MTAGASGEGGLPATSCPVRAVRLAGEAREPVDRDLAEEVAVGLVYGGVSFAVLMATPADIEDLARGFSLTEGVVEAPGEIRALRVLSDPDGLRVEMTIPAERMRRVLERNRAIAGRTGCGLCGIDDLSALPRPAIRPDPGTVPAAAAIRRALRALPEQQALFRRTGAVHAAAFVDGEGRIGTVREDVGRHNALDKLIGALAAEGRPAADGFALVTSRCSYEMVQKATVAGFGALVAISAPTALAVRLAERAGLALVAFARGDAMTVYAGGGRIDEAAE